jgi:transposase-like protein/predicted phosphodiesterase
MTIKQQVIDARLNRGYTYSAIKEEFGIAKSTARDWVETYLQSGDSSDVVTGSTFVNENLQRVKPTKFGKTEEEVLEFLEQLAPINVSSSNFTPTKTSQSDTVVVIGDMHFPKHCERSLNIVLETIAELQPRQIILNGDTVDLLAVSRYPKDIRHNYSLLDERAAYHKFLNDLISVAGNAHIVETHANHSGNGTDGRWFRYLSERLGELGSLPEIQEALSYENIFLGEFKDRIDHCDYVEICPDLAAFHGDVVRKFGGYSARGMIEKYYHSVLMGHTHRLGMTAQRIPGIGTRKDQQIYAWELGCLCDLDPIYASAPNWQNGFGIVTVDKEGYFGVEPVMINNGVANVATLGHTIKG